MGKSIWKKNVVLLVLIAIIAIIPLYLNKSAEFGGADGQAMDQAMEIAPDYEVWAEPILEPASGEIESLLFVLQAAVGAGVIGFILGRITTKKEACNKDEDRN